MMQRGESRPDRLLREQEIMPNCPKCGKARTLPLAHVCHFESGPLKPGPLKSDPLATFDAAIQTVTQQRGEIYGPPSVDFDRAARLKAVVVECKDPQIKHALEMICVKLARLIQSPDHLDSAIDVAGYARTIAMILDERAKNAG